MKIGLRRYKSNSYNVFREEILQTFERKITKALFFDRAMQRSQSVFKLLIVTLVDFKKL